MAQFWLTTSIDWTNSLPLFGMQLLHLLTRSGRDHWLISIGTCTSGTILDGDD